VKFGRVVSKMCEQTDKLTDKQIVITVLQARPGGEVITGTLLVKIEAQYSALNLSCLAAVSLKGIRISA